MEKRTDSAVKMEMKKSKSTTFNVAPVRGFPVYAQIRLHNLNEQVKDAQQKGDLKRMNARAEVRKLLINKFVSKNGVSPSIIAEILGVSRQRVYQLVK
jgi:hypothetical protein